MLRSALAAIGLMVLAACGGGGLSFNDATVDASHTCAVGSSNAAYVVQARIPADNSTSKAVDLTSIDAVMVVAAVHGKWQQPVGAKYDAGHVQFSPRSIGANAKATVTASIPSACTNIQHPGTTDNYADYSVQLTVNTSDGTFHVTSANKHRIVAP